MNGERFCKEGKISKSKKNKRGKGKEKKKTMGGKTRGEEDERACFETRRVCQQRLKVGWLVAKIDDQRDYRERKEERNKTDTGVYDNGNNSWMKDLKDSFTGIKSYWRVGGGGKHKEGKWGRVVKQR